MYSFCAMYSLRMSVWIVPRSLSRGDALLLADADVEREQDRRGRVDRHRRRDLAERDAREQRLHVLERVDRDALAADLAERARVVRVVAHQRRHVERRREPRLAVLEQVAEALVRLLRRPEAGELPHRPQPAAVHRRVDAARERERARVAEVAVVVDGRRCPASTSGSFSIPDIVEKSSPWRSGAAAYDSSRHASVGVVLPRVLGRRHLRDSARSGYRSPPGFQSGSSPPAFAARARMKSRSLSGSGRRRRADSRRASARAGEHLALGAPADRAGDVQARRRLGPARAGRSSSAPAAARSPRRSRARAGRSPPGDAQLPVALGERHGEVGAEVEELVLDALQPGVTGRDRAQPSTEFSSSTAP